MFLIYFPKSEVDTRQGRDDNVQAPVNNASVIFYVSIIHALLVLLVSILVLTRLPTFSQAWADLLGVGSTVLALIQYLPQLWTTWQLQHVMSLSIPMMCIQTPGSFVFAGSLAARLGVAGWSAWGVYVITGILQGGLLAMAITFELRDMRKVQENGAAGLTDHDSPSPDGTASQSRDEADETRPLLR